RDRVWCIDARQMRHHVPLRCVRAAALDHAVEIEHEVAAPDGAVHARPLKLGPAMPVKPLNVSVESAPPTCNGRCLPRASAACGRRCGRAPGLSTIAAYPAWRERGCPMGYSL